MLFLIKCRIMVIASTQLPSAIWFQFEIKKKISGCVYELPLPRYFEILKMFCKRNFRQGLVYDGKRIRRLDFEK